MTVAAVIFSTRTEDATALLDGVACVRHVADAAWSGGAIPIAVVAPDPDGAVADALSGSSVDLVALALAGAGASELILLGIEAAAASVAETTAALLWPVRMAWIDAGTATALIEAHAGAPAAVLRPSWAGQPGWPALVPLALVGMLRALAPDLSPDRLLAGMEEAGAPLRLLDLGDPGATHDVSTPRARLPAYAGPEQPVTGHPPDWGSDVAQAPPAE
ncbi:MAG: NTP transferase domain-containing protein [Candidatus Limnocylindrales bacterium]